MNPSTPCPFCASKNLSTDEISPGWFSVLCDGCGAIGPDGDSQTQAVLKWDDRKEV